MSNRDRRGAIAQWTLVVLVGLILAAAGVVIALRQTQSRPVQLTAAPTTAPATAPSTAPTISPIRPVDYMDVVRLNYPDFPTTQPLVIPASMSEAARLVINDPIYLDPIGELWITRRDAESDAAVLDQASHQSTHVTRERVVFVHRWPDETGVWKPMLICRRPDGGADDYEIITRSSSQDLSNVYHYDWPRAFSWNDAIVVPTDRGISVIRPDRRPMQLHHDFMSEQQFKSGKYTSVQAMLDWRGLIAWMPWDAGAGDGSRGAARFVDDKWITLDSSTGWPDKLLQLVPLLDGSVLQLIVNDDKTIDVALTNLDPPAIDQKKVAALVDQLSDSDSSKRLAAFNELTRFGSGAWPLLERLMPDQPPEAQIRLQQLLAAKTQPTLGGMVLQKGPLKTLARAENGGGAVFYAEQGVTIPREDIDEPTATVAPAWINIQPGRYIDLLPSGLISELETKGRQLAISHGEMIVIDDVEGPLWWLSNHLTPPLLKKGSEQQFRYLLGQDGRGRWLFRKRIDQPAPTLVIDPTLPDPTPHLPVWVFVVEGGEVGWTHDNWPAIKRGGAWALLNSDWKALDEKKDKFLSAIDVRAHEQTQEQKPVSIASTAPSTHPTTEASTQPTTAPVLGQPILTEADGNRFYDGQQTLLMIRPDGKQTTWPLPPEAVGNGGLVRLLRAGDNRLFLYNAPGRLLRIRQMPDDSPEPFKLEATFTHNIPDADHPDRIWLDPAGRLIFASGGNTLSICFPNGRIPPEIARKMTSADLQNAEQ